MKRESLQFGHGSFVGAVMRDPTFFDKSPKKRTRILGWANGCPVVKELVKVRGPEVMEPRYGEVNMWFGIIKDELESAGKPWFQHTLPRLSKPGKYEARSVPGKWYELKTRKS